MKRSQSEKKSTYTYCMIPTIRYSGKGKTMQMWLKSSVVARACRGEGR